MRPAARYLMTDPAHYAVRYRINPWMQPDVWAAGPAALSRRAASASRGLATTLTDLGAAIEWAPATEGLPDLVFPANAGVVLDRRVLAARFQRSERQGEEPVFRRMFEQLVARGLLDEVVSLPPGCVHEGAGDAIWDASRQLFWTGWGQRSDRKAADIIAETFRTPVIPLRLASTRFYHLDTCFCPLAGGEILYYPPAFSDASLRTIRERVRADQLIAATDQEAAAFNVNAISLGRDIVMAKPPRTLRARLENRGYRVHETALAPFILSGGAAFCMTLRLDLASRPLEATDDANADALALV